MNKYDRMMRHIVLALVGALIVFAIYNSMTWEDSIHNPDNAEYVLEVAFNLGIEYHEVTQKQFNQRYGK
jgi:hypothetical protein